MAKEPFEQFAMPNEVRAFVEQSVAQARAAFDGIANAATQAVSHWQGQAHAARAGASEIAHKSMAYAEQTVKDHAALVKAKGDAKPHAAAKRPRKPARKPTDKRTRKPTAKLTRERKSA